MFDDSSNTSHWLNRASAGGGHTKAAGRHSRSELCDLLSLSASTSEAGTLGEPSYEQCTTYEVAGRTSLQQDGLNYSTAATLVDPRHSSCAGFRHRPSQVATNQQKTPRKSSAAAVTPVTQQEVAAHQLAPNRLQQQQGVLPSTQQQQLQQQAQQQQHKARHSASSGQHRTSTAMPVLQLRPRSVSVPLEAHAAAVACGDHTSQPTAVAAAAIGLRPNAAPTAAAATAAADPAAASTGAGRKAGLPSQKELTERKLVKCLKKLQQDKQRYVVVQADLCMAEIRERRPGQASSSTGCL